MKKIIIFLLMSSLSFFAYSQQGDPNLPGAEASEGQNVDQLESEILTHLEPYIYDGEGRRDPFLPFKVFSEAPIEKEQFEKEETIATEVKKTVEPLLRYNLSQLDLKAILWNVKNPKVIVNDPGNKTHVLTKNDRIGNGGGYIAAIREGEVVVVQKISVQGKEIVTTKYMRLKR